MSFIHNNQLDELPEYVRVHELAKLQVKMDDEYLNETVPVDRLDEAEVITSKSKVFDNIHRPILDIDFPVDVIPSSTVGHYHLYIDKKLTWEQYKKLLFVLAEVGIIEEGYLNASIDREFTSVRLPWVNKHAE